MSSRVALSSFSMTATALISVQLLKSRQNLAGGFCAISCDNHKQNNICHVINYRKQAKHTLKILYFISVTMCVIYIYIYKYYAVRVSKLI
uniref:Uncharacterized protein n=1 Tax=Glossina palpalis gambiensis TaxID=67801 RepID=A0A1B0BF02_9MUSC